MSLSMGGYSFESIVTTGIPVCSRPDLNDVVDQFEGIKGESEVTDMPHGRDIRIRADFMGYDTYALLSAAISRVEAKINVLSDQTLTMTPDLPGETGVTFVHCTFKGFEPSEEAFVDGSGVNGWIQKGTLIFRQLKISN